MKNLEKVNQKIDGSEGLILMRSSLEKDGLIIYNEDGSVGFRFLREEPDEAVEITKSKLLREEPDEAVERTKFKFLREGSNKVVKRTKFELLKGESDEAVKRTKLQAIKETELQERPLEKTINCFKNLEEVISCFKIYERKPIYKFWVPEENKMIEFEEFKSIEYSGENNKHFLITTKTGETYRDNQGVLLISIGTRNCEGKRIFEGDLIKYGKDVSYVYYDRATFSFKTTPLKKTSLFKGALSLERACGSIIVGNVFESDKVK